MFDNDLQKCLIDDRFFLVEEKLDDFFLHFLRLGGLHEVRVDAAAKLHPLRQLGLVRLLQ